MMTDDEPSRPFESVSSDYFEHAGKHYLIYTDRLSGWPMVKMFNREATAAKLITTLRKFFAATGVPEVFRSDNGPQYIAGSIRKFLEHWAVRIRPSSPYYAQSNGHAEASVKAVKHLIIKCTRNGNLDSDEFAFGLLELRNSPRSDGRSPAQVLFGHPIRSIVPIHKRSYAEQWQINKDESKEKRETAKRKAAQRYNETAKPLPELRVGSEVYLQDHRTGRWSITGTIIEVGRYRQYLVKKKYGRQVWRNRRFIRKQHPILSIPKPNYPNSSHQSLPTQPDHYIPAQQSPEVCQSPCSPPPTHPSTDADHTTPGHSFVMPKIDHSKLTDLEFTIPKSFFKKSPYSQDSTSDTKALGARQRQPPNRLQLDPRRKTYSC